MNKKLLRNLIVSILGIVVLGVGYYFISNWEPEEKQNIPVESYEIISVYEKDIDSIQKIEFTNQTGSYSIIKNDKEYIIPEYPNARMLQSRLGTSFSIVKNFVAKRIIAESGNLSDYGLDAPAVKVNIVDKQGAIDSIYIGNSDPTNEGYYVKTNLSDIIYMVNTSTADIFFAGADYYRDMNISTFDITDVKTFELYEKDKLIASIRQKRDDDTLQDLVVDDLVMTYPYYEYVMSERLFAPFKELTEIKAISVVSDSAKDGKKYDVGKYVLKISEGEKNHVLKLGKKDAQGDVYAVYEGVDAVYTIDNAWLEAAVNFDAFDCLFKLVHVYNMDDVAKLNFVSDKGTHLFEINRSGSDWVYKINEVSVDEEVFKKAYLKIAEIRATSSVDKNRNPGREISKITFALNDGGNYTTKYCEYDDRNYMVIKSDGSKMLLLKKNFDTVYDEILQIIK